MDSSGITPLEYLPKKSKDANWFYQNLYLQTLILEIEEKRKKIVPKKTEEKLDPGANNSNDDKSERISPGPS